METGMNKLDFLMAKWSAAEHNEDYRAREYNNIVADLQAYMAVNQAISREEFYLKFSNHEVWIDFIPTSNAAQILGSGKLISIHPLKEDIEEIANAYKIASKFSYGTIRTQTDDGVIEFGTNEIAKVYHI